MRRSKNIIILLSSFFQDEAHNCSRKCNKNSFVNESRVIEPRDWRWRWFVSIRFDNRSNYFPLAAARCQWRSCRYEFQRVAVLVRIRRFSSSVINARRSIPRSVDFERSPGELRSSSVACQRTTLGRATAFTFDDSISRLRLRHERVSLAVLYRRIRVWIATHVVMFQCTILILSV